MLLKCHRVLSLVFTCLNITLYLFTWFLFFCQMVTVNSLQAIYKLLCASPDTSTLGKQLNAQLINVRTVTALLQIANNAQVEYTYIGETGHFLSPGNSTLMTLLVFDIRSHLLGFGSKWGKLGALLFFSLSFSLTVCDHSRQGKLKDFTVVHVEDQLANLGLHVSSCQHSNCLVPVPPRYLLL